MRSIALLVSALAAVGAFSPAQFRTTETAPCTQLDMVSRRDALTGFLATSLLIPGTAHAFSQQLDDYAYEPQQQATDGKWDLNSAFVVSTLLPTVLLDSMIPLMYVRTCLTYHFLHFPTSRYVLESVFVTVDACSDQIIRVTTNTSLECFPPLPER